MPALKIDPDEVPEEVRGRVLQFLRRVARRLSDELYQEAPVGATGSLQSSFQILSETDERIFVGSRIDYADDVAFGTDPHRPNFENLQVWARRKLGNEELAGPVFRKISQEGTEPNRYDERAVVNTIQHFQ
jgi:hypothetical protein